MNGAGMNHKCSEGETVGFVEDLDNVCPAVKTMSSMLNRFNHAKIVIGVDKNGEPLGRTFSKDDFPLIDRAIREKLNRIPRYSLKIGS